MKFIMIPMLALLFLAACTAGSGTYNGSAIIFEQNAISDLTLVADFNAGKMSGTATTWIDADSKQVLTGSVHYYAPVMHTGVFPIHVKGTVNGMSYNTTLMASFDDMFNMTVGVDASNVNTVNHSIVADYRN